MELRDYNGIRLTADGFDCALPVAIDSHTICTFDCQYCFAQNIVGHHENRNAPVGQTPIRYVEKLLNGTGPKEYEVYRRALHFRHPDRDYPCAIQVGALADPFDNLERKNKWTLELIRLARKYNQPFRFSTKGTAGVLPEYLEEFGRAPHLFWISFSINTPDDKLIKQIDKNAPSATERLNAMKALSDIGVRVSLRLRPAFPGISDSTPDHPHAYAELIGRAKDAGARAISYEVGFLDGHATPYLRSRYKAMEDATGIPYMKIYESFGKAQACSRPSYQFTEEFMFAVHREAKKANFDIGVSDPCWKQLGDCGCCCGIRADDKVFGNWQTESATNQMYVARDGGKEIGPNDIIPEWSYDILLSKLCDLRPGPRNIYKKRHLTWADKLRSQWNDVKYERGPYVYFQGAMVPTRRDDNGDLFYKYVGLKPTGRTNTPYWRV